MKVNEDVWAFMQKHLGYNDEEMKLFRQNPRNEDIMSKADAFLSKNIIIEVVESHGCNSGHQAGDKFIFDGAGNLITRLNPKKICCFALGNIAGLVFAAHELLYAGIDPNEMRFKRVGCFDIGVRCGGWGRVIMEMKMEDRRKA